MELLGALRSNPTSIVDGAIFRSASWPITTVEQVHSSQKILRWDTLYKDAFAGAYSIVHHHKSISFFPFWSINSFFTRRTCLQIKLQGNTIPLMESKLKILIIFTLATPMSSQLLPAHAYSSQAIDFAVLFKAYGNPPRWEFVWHMRDSRTLHLSIAQQSRGLHQTLRYLYKFWGVRWKDIKMKAVCYWAVEHGSGAKIIFTTRHLSVPLQITSTHLKCGVSTKKTLFNLSCKISPRY